MAAKANDFHTFANGYFAAGKHSVDSCQNPLAIPPIVRAPKILKVQLSVVESYLTVPALKSQCRVVFSLPKHVKGENA